MHVVSDSGAGSATGEWTWAAVFGLTALITAGEVVYSQTMACVVALPTPCVPPRAVMP